MLLLLFLGSAPVMAQQQHVTVGGNVFGGGNLANVGGSSTVLVNQANASVGGDVYGGGAKALVNVTINGTDTSRTANTTTSVTLTEGTVHGNVYGGGLGYTKANNTEQDTAANVYGPVTVTINGGTVNRSVYGCNNIHGAPKSTVQVNIEDGIVMQDVYGGGNLASSPASPEVNIDSGTVHRDVYGGGALADVTGAPTVNVMGGTIHGNVYGGGLGRVTVADDESTPDVNESVSAIPAAVNGIVQVNIGAAPVAPSTDTLGDATILGMVFGGNNINGSPKDSIRVDIWKTHRTSAQEVGGFANETAFLTYATSNAAAHSTSSFALQAVYGGSNLANYEPNTGKGARVWVHGCDNTVKMLYGGGRAAAVGTSLVNADTKVIVDGGRIDTLFAGGDGHTKNGNGDYIPADIHGSVNAHVRGGFYTAVFGASNTAGTITGSKNVVIDKSGPCANEPEAICTLFGGGNKADAEGDVSLTVECGAGYFDEVYGGCNLANVNNGNVILTIKGGHFNSVYGGSKGDLESLATVAAPNHSEKAANISGNVTLNLYGGTMTNAFGGSNINGNIGGKITVNVLDYEASNCELDVTNIYGAGNWTAYRPTYSVGQGESRLSPVVNVIHIKSGNSIRGNVYGGGKGDTDHNAIVVANPVVNIGYNSSMYDTIPSDYFTETTLSSTDDFIATVTGNVFGGGDLAEVAGSTTVNLQKSNSSVASLFGGGNQASVGNTDVNVTGGSVSTGVYGGCNTSGTVGGTINETSFNGDITVDIESNLGSNGSPLTEGIYGGGKGSATLTTGNVTVTVGDGSTPTIYADVYGGSALGSVNYDATDLTKIDFKNGTLYGNIYGGGMGQVAENENPAIAAQVNGGVQVDVSGGTVGGGSTGPGVYGGCNYYGTVSGDIAVNLTGGAVGASGNGNGADVFGGGYGASTSTGGDVAVTVDGATVYGDVYGGSALGNINGTSADSTLVILASGTVSGNLYGGGLGNNDHAAAVNGSVHVTVNGGSVTDVFGCNNVNGSPQSTVKVDIIDTATINANHVSVNDVFGGGNLATYTGNPVVNVLNGTVSNNVYGGGKGVLASGDDRGQKGKVTGNPQVTIGDNNNSHTAHVTGDVYGGGDAAHVVGTPVVVVNDCNTTIGDLYGGGNAADVTGTNVTVNGGTINQAYGGGHGDKTVTEAPLKYADVNGNVVFDVYGGTIAKVFAGSNSKGSITGNSIALNIDKTGSCAMKIAEVYGGGNEAAGNAGTITIGCTGSWTVDDDDTDDNNNFHNKHNNTDNRIGYELEGIGTVYGGANQADVTNDIALNIYSGIIENVFGGNNTSGNISGSITVNIEKNNNASCASDWYLGNVYGGGNLAAYRPSTPGSYPAVNIKNGTVSQNVFGGGLGASAKVCSNPVVTVGDPTNNAYQAIVTGNVYGGGSAAMVGDDVQATASTNGTTVLIQKANSSVAKVFGGGMAAGVTGTTSVTISGGTVSTGLYGGCDASGTVGGNITVALNGGTVGTSVITTDAVFGGGYGHSTSTTGDITVTLNGSTIYGDLYGGSALGSVNGSSNTTTVTLSSNGLHGNVFGGGMGSGSGASTQATTRGDVVINYNTANTSLTGIYGGANVNGDVAGDIEVNIEANVGASGPGNSIDIYGGGLGQNTTTSGDVTVTVGNSSTPIIYGDVYGGSENGEVGAANKLAKVDFKDGTLNGTIYGGGKGQNSPASYSATVSGGTEVAVSGGTVTGGIYGGCNINGSVAEAVTVNLTAGTVGVNNVTDNAVFGGGLGANTTTGSNVTVTLDGATVYGALYGGSALGSVNDAVAELTTVDILSGEIHGNIYGGGLGKAGAADSGQVNGTIIVNIGSGTPDASAPGGATGVSGSATIDGSVYGCNNTNGSPQGNVTVNIYSTDHTTTPTDNTYSGTAYAIANVFGGGKNADFTTAGKIATVNVFTCANTIGNFYGGGDAADVPGSAVTIWGGRFDKVFGGGNGAGESNPGADIGAGGITIAIHGGNVGTLVNASNEKGSIGGAINVTVDNVGGCDEEVTDFFGGSNMVNIGTNESPINVTTTIECGAGTFGAVYGGSNAANIIGNVVLNIKGGTMTNVFGGSKGVLQVGTSSDLNYVAPVAANITGNVTLNLYGGTITNNAFGGSNYNGNITGTITVNVLDHEGDCKLDVNNIYGAGNLTAYEPTYAVGVGEPRISPVINVMHIKVADAVEDDPNTTDVDESRPAIPGIRGSVFGGGKGDPGDNSQELGMVTANPQVNIGYNASTMAALANVDYPNASAISRDSYTAVICGNLIGGGDAAKVTGSPLVTVYKGQVNERIVGGGNAANVTGSTHVVINDGTHGLGTGESRGVYGGCNTSGTVGGNVVVDILGGSFGSQQIIDNYVSYNIHGGGYGSSTIVTGDVTVNYGAVSIDNNNVETHSEYPKLYGDLYGGSALGTVNGTTVDPNKKTTVNVLNGSFGYKDEILTQGIVQHGGNIYGGGLGDASNPATVNGVIYVKIGAAPVAPATTPTGKADLRHCNVYGCNNAYGSPQENVYVDVYQTKHTTTDIASYNPSSNQADPTYAIQNVFGGGNNANYAPTPNPTDGNGRPTKRAYTSVHYCTNTIENLYGGGNAADVVRAQIAVDGGRYKFIFAGGNGQISAANIGNGGVDIEIKSGRVGWYFEGCNMHGTIGYGVESNNGCTGVSCPCEQTDLIVENYYFGANMATVYGGLNDTVSCGGEAFIYKKVYAGSRLATVYGDINIIVSGGTIDNLFGGCEGSQYISADVRKYPVDWQSHRTDGTYDVEMISFLDSVLTYHHVDLGGQGGNITITLKGGKLGNVYGGCDYRGNVEGNIWIIVDSSTVSLDECRLDIDYIYGGNNLAEYAPDGDTPSPTRVSPLIELKRGHVNYDVYGGSKGGDPDHHFGNGLVISNPKVIVGGYVDPDNPNNKYRFRIGHIDRTVPANPVVYGDLYGGGSAANVKGNTEVVIWGTVDGEGNPSTVIENNVFGGGKSGDVDGNTKVTVVPTQP